jgi:hypothetical protein
MFLAIEGVSWKAKVINHETTYRAVALGGHDPDACIGSCGASQLCLFHRWCEPGSGARQILLALNDDGQLGGDSDGNFTGALGIATLDGLGGLGAGAHTHQEHHLISSLVPRALPLARLLSELG